MEIEVYCEVAQGIHLPENKKYQIEIACKEFSFQTKGKPKSEKENFIWWNQRFDR